MCRGDIEGEIKIKGKDNLIRFLFVYGDIRIDANSHLLFCFHFLLLFDFLFYFSKGDFFSFSSLFYRLFVFLSTFYFSVDCCVLFLLEERWCSFLLHVSTGDDTAIRPRYYRTLGRSFPMVSSLFSFPSCLSLN